VRVLAALESAGIPYMLTGSVAASYHGRPRATHDVDMVIDPAAHQLDRFLHEVTAAGFYVDPDGARAALRDRRQFNVIETRHASKIDLIIKKHRPFSTEEFERRRPVDLALGRAVPIVSAEDVIVAKLEWARRSGDSERQIRDAAGVLELNPDLDRDYIARWTAELGVDDLWRGIAGGR